MRQILFLAVLAAACLAASSTPIDAPHRLVNLPPSKLENRVKRSEPFAKGHPATNIKPDISLRKGEFMCGDKVCKLRPGDKPPCDHCQYPI